MYLGTSADIDAIVQRALEEDVGSGDVTSNWILDDSVLLKGHFLAKASGIVAGIDVVRRVFAAADSGIRFESDVEDGDPVARGDVFARVEGPGKGILSAERVALNLLQRMSGIATATNAYVQAVRGTKAIIIDTRKTAPGLRVLDKMAVRMGGGQNHRFGLFDMVLIKDNHIAAAGGITAAVERVRQHNSAGLAIEVEVTSLKQLREALSLHVDRIMLDNMDLEEMRQAVILTNGSTELEASGGVNLETVAAIAQTGVDFISVGALTHSVKAMDISLDVEECR